MLSGVFAQTAKGEESLGDKVNKLLATPTPTPRKKRKHSPTRQSPTPSPSPADEASLAPSPSASPKSKSTSKKKKKTSSESKPAASVSATPEESRSESNDGSDEKADSTGSSTSSKSKGHEPNATISSDELSGYDSYSPAVRKLIDSALALTRQNLDYTYGSADPANGGMDCSGFVYYILRENGVHDVPRDSSEQYVWLRKTGKFNAVLSRNIDSFELDALKPGDLLFWCGTYNINRDPPITHTMIFLGREKGTKKRVMVGSSDGRSYEGKPRFGVSVFDFKLPNPSSDPDAKRGPIFVGYGSIPGLGDNKE
jgi:peptidoglycan DL-endopeptidase CwlO